MDNNKKSLVTKIIEKGVITPYEAIYLQHLNTLNSREQIGSIDYNGNYYLEIERMPQLLHPYLLKQLVTFRQDQDGRQYEAYQWVASDLASFEKSVGEIGYMGLALLNEIRYMRAENLIEALTNKISERPIINNLFEYKTYSRVNQKRVTFNEVLGSFGIAFRILITAIDIILTNNYYLKNMFKHDELNCLKYLTMWLRQESEEKDLDKEELMEPFLNITASCCKNSLDLILNDNHPKLVEMMRNKIESFGVSLPNSFETGSLEYVKETINEIVNRDVTNI